MNSLDGGVIVCFRTDHLRKVNSIIKLAKRVAVKVDSNGVLCFQIIIEHEENSITYIEFLVSNSNLTQPIHSVSVIPNRSQRLSCRWNYSQSRSRLNVILWLLFELLIKLVILLYGVHQIQFNFQSNTFIPFISWQKRPMKETTCCWSQLHKILNTLSLALLFSVVWSLNNKLEFKNSCWFRFSLQYPVAVCKCIHSPNLKMEKV